MPEQPIEKAIMAMMMAIVGLVVMTQVVQGMEPAPPPPPQYCCPIEPDVCFYTYDELYEHFTTAHPSEPIEINWE